MKLYDHSEKPVTIHFTRQASPVDSRLAMLGELRDGNGRRVWAGYGRTEADIMRTAAAWLDDCHGRAGHTPDIKVDESWPFHVLALSIQVEVQHRQSARLN